MTRHRIYRTFSIVAPADRQAEAAKKRLNEGLMTGCIAEALELPDVMCYGKTPDEAISNTERLAIEVIADRIAHGELTSSALGLSFLRAFSIPDEQLARQ